MFMHNDVAQKVTLGSTKMSRIITYGLAPFFHDQLTNSLSLSNYIVASFDKSLNEVIRKDQVDLCI